MDLVWPAAPYLDGLKAALARGWSPDNLRAEAAREEIDKIEADPGRYLALQVDREARGGPITLPDGKSAPRLPSYSCWMWDGEFCGVIGLRWQPGTTELPPYCLGHIGYAVVPWKRGRGYATLALGLMLLAAKDEGLPFVEITTDKTNDASKRVIESNGGVVVEEFDKPAAYGGMPSLRYRIALG